MFCQLQVEHVAQVEFLNYFQNWDIMDKQKPKKRLSKLAKITAFVLLISWVSINYELSHAFNEFDRVLNSE